ncbi:MAG TPA: hypothetical protein VMT08_35000, partial [Bradyrhizobium sp.]|nr:hypothetical protein [Bradyrhizobium sp.]
FAAPVAATESRAAAAANIVAFESIRGRDISVLSVMADDTGRWHTCRKPCREEAKRRAKLEKL